MSDKIKKLNKLEHPSSFIQLNTIKGFKYVDKAGEIVNEYHDKNTPPEFTMNLNGLVIKNPSNNLDELRITPNTIWARLESAGSLEQIESAFQKNVEKITSILEIEKIKRFGWRNYYIFECQNKEEMEGYFKKNFSLEMGDLTYAEVNITKGDIEANVRIKQMIKADDSEKFGVLFDIDTFVNKEIKVSEIKTLSGQFKTFLKEDFLNLVNNFLKD